MDCPAVQMHMGRTTDLTLAPAGPLGLVAPPPIEIECEAFKGSLGTLVRFAQDHKVDLLGVPLLPICQAYFSYLVETAGQDLDTAASALVALAYLLERKAWMLLPVPETEPEIDDELALEAPSAHEYSPAIEALRVWHDERELRFFRSGDSEAYELPFELGSVTSKDLAFALERLLRRAQPEPLEHVGKPRRSLSEQMVIVLRALKNEFLSLDELVVGHFTRTEAVWWFLALLELIRLGQALAKLEEGDVRFARRSS